MTKWDSCARSACSDVRDERLRFVSGSCDLGREGQRGGVAVALLRRHKADAIYTF
jgi:hypothetical protein